MKRIDAGLKVFGSNLHRYALHTLSERGVKRFESDLGVSLPRAYREHLLKVGYGAGPYYGLFSPRQVMNELACDEEYVRDFGCRPNPAGEFPFTREDATRICRSVEAGEEEPWGKATYPSHGTIPIAHQGCTYWTMLVTSGALRGCVWSAACYVGYDGLWMPSRRPPTLHTRDAPSCNLTTLPDLPTFDEWFDSWVEAALLDVRDVRHRSPLRRLADKLFKGPFGDR